MKTYIKFSYLKKTKIFLLIIVAFSFAPLDAFVKDTTPPAITMEETGIKAATTANKHTTTTTSALSTSTPTDKEFLCPVSFILKEEQHQQKILRSLRDEVLAKHEKGISYTNLFYLHSPEITLIMLSNDDIKTNAGKILIEILLVATALIKEGKAELSQQLIDEIDSLLNEIAHKADSQLREVLKKAKSDLIKKEIFKDLGIKIIK
jgi:hypothetical protein